MLKNQKVFIQGDQDNTQPEEDLESAKKLKPNPIVSKAFKEDKDEKNQENGKKSPKDDKIEKDKLDNSGFLKNAEYEAAVLKKKDHKTRFLTTVGGTGGINSDAETKNLEQKHEKVKAINNHPYRHLIFCPIVTESTLKKHLSITYRGLVYSVKCLKGPTDKFIKTKQVSLIDPKS